MAIKKSSASSGLAFTGMRVLLLALTIFCAPIARAQIETPAEFALIMDHETGAILFEKNADVATAPASMSKLMTVAVVFDRLKNGQLKLTDEFSVSEKAWRMQGSKMWVRVDTKIKVEDLLRGVIVQSGNDACVVLAENISGTEEAFAELMTRQAREWGLTNSQFANASGWPDANHKMSMRDLALLSRHIVEEYPDLYKMFNERSFTWEKIKQPNRNPLFDLVPNVDGLKTGHTEESGYGLVGTAIADGQRRYIVVNGLASEKERATESARLMRIAFNDFTNKTLFSKGAIVGEAEIFAGVAPTVQLVTAEPVSLILHRASAEKLRARLVYQGPVEAPIKAGQQIGVLKVEAGSDAREYPLFAASAVKETGFLGRLHLAAKKLFFKSPSPEGQQLEADAFDEAGAGHGQRSASTQ